MGEKQDISQLPPKKPMPPLYKAALFIVSGGLALVLCCGIFNTFLNSRSTTPTAVAQQEIASTPTEAPTESDPPTPTAEPAKEETVDTPDPTATQAATDTPEPEPTEAPTDTPEPPTATIAPTNTPAPTDTPVSLPTNTPVPVAPTNTPIPVPPTDTPAPPPPVQIGLSKDSAVGVQKQIGIWAMKLYQVKKAKAVYFFGDADVADGVYLMPFVEFTNTGAGSRAPVEDLDLYIVDGSANRYDLGFSDGDLGAAHQFQAGHIWDDMDPGAVLGIVIPGDVPEGITDAWLKADQDPNFIMYLGDASALPLE